MITQVLERLLRRPRLRSRPIWFLVEASGYCNFRCPACPQSVKGRIDGGFLSLRDWTVIHNKIRACAKRLSFANWGEPLLNPDLFEMISDAAMDGIRTDCSSNFLAVTESQMDRLAVCGLHHLTISCDGLTRDSCRYRIGGDPEKVVRNIGKMAAIRDRRQSKLDIAWQVVVNRFNESELPEIRRRCDELGIWCSPVAMRPVMHMEPFCDDAAKLSQLQNWLPVRESSRALYSYERILQSGRKRHCWSPWTSMVINWDGGVYPCCSLYGSQYYFGNLLHESLEAIWNGLGYQRSRSALTTWTKSVRGNHCCALCRQNNFPCK